MFQPEALNEAWTHHLFITNEVSPIDITLLE